MENSEHRVTSGEPFDFGLLRRDLDRHADQHAAQLTEETQVTEKEEAQIRLPLAEA